MYTNPVNRSDAPDLVTQTFFYRVGEKLGVNPLFGNVVKHITWFASSMVVPPQKEKEQKPYYLPSSTKDRLIQPNENEWISTNQKMMSVVYGIQSVFALIVPDVTWGVSSLSLVQANQPQITAAQKKLRERVGPELSEVCFHVVETVEKEPRSQLVAALKRVFECLRVKNSQKLAEETAEGCSQSLKNGIVHPEYALLKTLDHLQEEIAQTSPEKLLQTLEVIEDFLKTYEVACEKLASQPFANAQEEEQAWAKEMGPFWHEAFSLDENPVTKTAAIDRYLNILLDRVKQILLPNLNAFPVAQTAALEFGIAWLEVEIWPEFRNMFISLTKPSLYLGGFLKAAFGFLEQLALRIEEKLHLQVLPEVSDDKVLYCQNNTVRGCSEKAKQWGLYIGMQTSAAEKILKEHLPENTELVVVECNAPMSNSHEILVDTVGSREIVRALPQNLQGEKDLYVGMLASEAEHWINLNNPSGKTALLIRRGEPGADAYFAGRMPVRDLFVRIMTLLIDHSMDASLDLLNNKIRGLSKVRKAMSMTLAVARLLFWPLQKTFALTLRYLTGVSSTEKMAGEFFDKILATLFSPAFKSLPFLWVDRFLSELEGVSAKNALPVMKEVQGDGKAVPMGAYSRKAVIGNISLALVKTVVDTVPLRAPKSKIMRGGFSLLFWTMRKLTLLPFKLLDTSAGHFVIDKGVKVAAFKAWNFYQNKGRSPKNQREISAEHRFMVEEGFQFTKRIIHAIAQDQGSLKTVHGIITEVYSKAAELQLTDPDYQRFAAANRNWGEFIHELDLLAARTVPHFIRAQKKETTSYSYWKELSQFKTLSAVFTANPSKIFGQEEGKVEGSLSSSYVDRIVFESTNMRREKEQIRDEEQRKNLTQDLTLLEKVVSAEGTISSDEILQKLDWKKIQEVIAKRMEERFIRAQEKETTFSLWNELSQFKTLSLVFTANHSKIFGQEEGKVDESLLNDYLDRVGFEGTNMRRDLEELEQENENLSGQIEKIEKVEKLKEAGDKVVAYRNFFKTTLEDSKRKINAARENGGATTSAYENFTFLKGIYEGLLEVDRYKKDTEENKAVCGEKWFTDEMRKLQEAENFILLAADTWLKGQKWILEAKQTQNQGQQQNLRMDLALLERAIDCNGTIASDEVLQKLDWKKIQGVIAQRMEKRLHVANTNQFSSVREKAKEEVEQQLAKARQEYNDFLLKGLPQWENELLEDSKLMEKFYKEQNKLESDPPASIKNFLKDYLSKDCLSNVLDWQTKMKEHFQGDQIKRQQILKDLRTFCPALFEANDRKQVLLKARIEELEEQELSFKQFFTINEKNNEKKKKKMSANMCCYLDAIWWLDRSGAECLDPLKQLAFLFSKDAELTDQQTFAPAKVKTKTE